MRYLINHNFAHCMYVLFNQFMFSVRMHALLIKAYFALSMHVLFNLLLFHACKFVSRPAHLRYFNSGASEEVLIQSLAGKSSRIFSVNEVSEEIYSQEPLLKLSWQEEIET